jgi:hypothetical protein
MRRRQPVAPNGMGVHEHLIEDGTDSWDDL